MPLDANGVHIYDEFEDAAPVSEMLNRLGESVSDAIGPFIGDTGWLPMTVSTDTTISTGYEAQVRQMGAEVRIRVRSARTTWATGQLWFTMPTAITPPSRNTELVPNRSPSNNPTRVQVGTDRTIRTPQAAGSGTMNMWLNDSYWTD